MVGERGAGRLGRNKREVSGKGGTVILGVNLSEPIELYTYNLFSDENNAFRNVCVCVSHIHPKVLAPD